MVESAQPHRVQPNSCTGGVATFFHRRRYLALFDLLRPTLIAGSAALYFGGTLAGLSAALGALGGTAIILMRYRRRLISAAGSIDGWSASAEATLDSSLNPLVGFGESNPSGDAGRSQGGPPTIARSIWNRFYASRQSDCPTPFELGVGDFSSNGLLSADHRHRARGSYHRQPGACRHLRQPGGSNSVCKRRGEGVI